MSDLSLRASTNADLPAVARLVRAVLESYGFTLDEASLARDLGQEQAWVALRRGAVIGCIVLRSTGELSRFYVEPGERRSGVGRRLYDALEAEARERGIRKLHMASSRRFVDAHRFYLARGFRLVRSLDNDWEDDVFEKSLSETPGGPPPPTAPDRPTG